MIKEPELSAVRKGYIRFLCWLHRYEEFPHFNRAAAGLHQLLWTHFCGWTWKDGWRMAWGYWRPAAARKGKAA